MNGCNAKYIPTLKFLSNNIFLRFFFYLSNAFIMFINV